MIKLDERGSSRLRCACCHGELSGLELCRKCPGCGTLTHRDCAEDGCPTLGCAGDPGEDSRVAALRVDLQVKLAEIHMYLDRRMGTLEQTLERQGAEHRGERWRLVFCVFWLPLLFAAAAGFALTELASRTW